MAEKWHRWASREGVDLTTIFEIDSVFYDLIWQATGKKGEVFFTSLKDRVFTHYSNVDLHAVGQYVYRKYLNDKESIEKLIKLGEKIIDESIKNSAARKERLSAETGHSILSESLNEFILEYDTVSRYFSVMPFIAIEAWQQDCESVVSKLIEAKTAQNERQKFYASIYKPVGRTALIELSERLKKGVAIDDLVEAFQFLRSWSVIWNNPIDKKWILALKAKPSETEALYSQKEILEKLQPGAAEKHFLEMAPYMVHFKDWRDDLRRRQTFNWSFLFDRIAEFFKINRDDLGYLSFSEISDALGNHKVLLNLIEKRKNEIAIVTSSPEKISMKILCGKDTDKYKQIIADAEQEGPITDIKGVVAQKGKVVGKVQLIREYKDVNNFKEGAVLVAITTHPNYLPAMQKAAAIVTDEGSIASHAAIVARELKIPCIVGTKNATKILRDGIKVEVNANDGTVKIVEKANEK